MTRLSAQELLELREDGLSAARRREFDESARICQAWDLAHPLTLDGVLDWIDELRVTFGEPETSRAPWRGNDFRL
ncbi:MAG: hypothetical protein WEF50_03535 [Myxococcota bacterium]